MKKYIYAIYPLDSSGYAASVYVGCSKCVESRIRQHLYNKTPSYGSPNMRAEMSKHGYAYQVLDRVEESEQYLEYDYIDYFIKYTDLPVLNTKIGNHADGRKALYRILGQIPFEGGKQ